MSSSTAIVSFSLNGTQSVSLSELPAQSVESVSDRLSTIKIRFIHDYFSVRNCSWLLLYHCHTILFFHIDNCYTVTARRRFLLQKQLPNINLSLKLQMEITFTITLGKFMNTYGIIHTTKTNLNTVSITYLSISFIAI